MTVCVNCAKFKGCDLSSPNVNECADYKEILTNEEYLRSVGTDGLTAIFMQFMFDAEFKARFVNGNFITEFRKWLKEKHE